MTEAEGGHVLPYRECKGCGIIFQQLHLAQTYHDVPCRVDATDRSRRAKALEKSGRWKISLRACKGCRVVFQPVAAIQTYHDVPCRKAATIRGRSVVYHGKKNAILRAAKAIEEKRVKRLAESDKFIRGFLKEVVLEATNRMMEPLMALAEKASTAEGYEFEAIPAEHPRWADPSDLARSARNNVPWAVE